MAGESPGKSEQRKSSGEAARGEGGSERELGPESERDPRLAVFGGSSPSTTDSPDEVPEGGPDEGLDDGPDESLDEDPDDGPDEILNEALDEGSDKAPDEGPADARDEAPADEESAGGDAAGDAAATSGAGDDQGNSRLRAAVAAWVASADADADADGDGDADAGTDADADADADAAPSGREEREAEVAAKVAGDSAAGDSAPDESAADRSGKPDTDLPKRRPADRPTTAVGTYREPTEEPTEPTEPTANEPGSEAARDASADASTKPPEALEDASEAGTSEGARTSGTDTSEGAGKPEGAAAKNPVDQPTGVFRAVQPSGGREPSGSAEDVPERPVEAQAEASPSASGKAAEDETPSEPGKGAGTPEDAAPKKPVDQPTTTFKAVRPETRESGGGDAGSDKAPAARAEKPVDQPTTALKTLRPGGGARGGRAGEREAERTSRFVPLKSDDLAQRKPRSAVGTAEATEAKATEAKEAEKAKDAKEAEKATEAKAGSASAALAKPTEAPAPAKSPAPAKPDTPAVPPQPTGAPPKPSAAPSLPESERTKQQPLPDPAPLELLAQLTNTPPPPETPLRTIVWRIKIWTPLAVLLAVILATVQALRPLPEPTLDLTARTTYEFDGAKPSMPWPATGQAAVGVDGLGSFGTFGEQKPVPIASVAKTMTAYVILKDHPLKKGTHGDTIPVDKKAEDDAKLGAQNESVVETEEGETLTEYEALQAIMIASANNVARLLARWDANGSEKAFVEKMNDAAKDLGMKNTTYTDPSGLDATTVSTAEDQVKLGRKVMQDPVFREIVAQPSYKDRNGTVQQNWNRLVPFHGVGIKTGTSTAAQGNLLFAAEKRVGGTTQLIIGAVLRQPPAPSDNSILTGAVDASKPLITAAGDALTSRKVVKKGDVVGQVDDGLGGTTPVVATKDVSAVGWTGLTVDIALTDNGKTVPHVAKAGTEVGTMTVGNGLGQVKVPIALQKDLVEPGLGDKLTRIL
ncbi:D-alanyl-D-alanine carboxypeptidase [Streptomyces sp. 7N604]|uniref:D-alanyl-D-alanine carboxypeptidase n=1 Tax=Streptomyces sp. 7N604 TaxID=3457415 RepID=UPI003FD2C6F8